MRVSDFDDFDRLETEGLLTGSRERSWLWFGLVVSLAIHFALCAYFYRTRFQSLETLVAQNEQTPTFKRPNTFTSKMPGDSAGPIKGHTAGFSDLDQLLAQKGPLGSGTKLRLPDDQLFEYDSDVLQSSAISQLQKLGTLIQRNPKATFSVEGYTDAFGSFEYNLNLSQRRADSVKRYLVEVMRINPAQIETHGYGATKFRASQNGSIEEQSANRRVEVVVHTSEG